MSLDAHPPHRAISAHTGTEPNLRKIVAKESCSQEVPRALVKRVVGCESFTVGGSVAHGMICFKNSTDLDSGLGPRPNGVVAVKHIIV